MSRSSRSSPATPELSAVAAGAVILGFALGGVLGYLSGGLAGAFAGALAASTVAVVVYGAGKLKEGNRSLSTDSVPNLQGLAPQQALGIMSAMVAGDHAPAGGAFRSELLDALAKIADNSQDAPQWALDEIEKLCDRHPRSPAVHAELARLRFRLDQPTAGLASVRVAIGFALDGGMNPMAAALFVEFAPHRDALALPRPHLARLAKVLAARGEAEGSAWCNRATETEEPSVAVEG